MKFTKSLILLSVFYIFSHGLLYAANVENIRIGIKNIFTRVVLDLSQAPSIYNVSYESNPERVLVEFENGDINPRALKSTADYPLISSLSTQSLGNNGYRVQIELSRASSFKHFLLPPATRAGHRLVIDITPGEKPVSNSIKKKEPVSKNTQTIIAPADNLTRGSNEQDLNNETEVTNYQARAVDVYEQPPSDLFIEQLLLPLQGNTQLSDRYSDEVKTSKVFKPEKSILNQKVITPRFDIRGYKVKGNTLLSRVELATILKPYTGSQRDFGDVQKALEALELKYQQIGYGMVQVYLPEQELTRGIVTFNIIEPKIKTLSVEGAKHFDLDNIKNSLVSITTGKTPSTTEVAENLALLNENPAKRTTVQFLPGEEEGVLNTVIQVKDKDPGNFSVSLDNTGTESTGLFRLGLSYQHANLTNNDDVLNAQFIMSEKANAVKIYGLGYHYPLYQLNSSLDIFGGYSEVDSGVISNLFTVSGKGLVLGVRFNQVLPKYGSYTHRLSYGIDYRQYDTDAIPISGGSSIVPDINVKPLSLTYSGQLTQPGAVTAFNAQVHANLLATDTDEAQFQSSRTNARAKYSIFRYGFEHARSFAKTWQMRLAISGQETVNALVSGEQFGIGGSNSVRGYLEREVSNDNGIQLTTEVYSPDFSSSLGFSGDMRALAFYDYGEVTRNLALASETLKSTLKSIGIGLRLSRKDSLNARLDIAYPLVDGISQEKGQTRVHASVQYIF